MASKPKGLRPTELARVINSTPLGEVVTVERLYRQRDRAGYRIGDGRTIEFARYAGWLFHEWWDHKNNVRAQMSRAERHRVDEGARLRNRRESIRNIGAIPRIADIARRESCRSDLAKFIMTYAGEGKHPFSDDHIKVIKC